MACQNEDLRLELLAMVAADLDLRADLLERGVLHEGYHPEMESIHTRHASRLEQIISRVGWPTAQMVGDDGAKAAWLIAQHAIGNPPFQRRCLVLLQAAANTGASALWQAAMLEDRIRMFEGQPQVYGTQLETENGVVRAYLVEDPERVDERRARVGLEPLNDRIARETPSPPPTDPERFTQEYQAWLRRVGWRS